MNNVNLIGNLTKDPEVRVSNDLAIARFSIAINRTPGKDGQDRGADFPNITVFGRQAENCEKYLHKGSKVAVEGRIQTGSYKDKDERTVYTTDVIANRIEFLSSKPKEEHAGFEAISEEDCPF